MTPTPKRAEEIADRLLMNEATAVVFGGVQHVKPGFRDEIVKALEEYARIIEFETAKKMEGLIYSMRERAAILASNWEGSGSDEQGYYPCNIPKEIRALPLLDPAEPGGSL